MSGAELVHGRIEVGSDKALFERVSQLRYAELLGRCIRAASVAVFSSSMVVTLVLGLFTLMSRGRVMDMGWLLPLLALKVGFIAALLGIVPALLLCSPLWALLLRWRAGHVLSFVGAGALPGILLMAWESGVGIAFLLYGVPASMMCWWLVKRWLKSEGA